MAQQKDLMAFVHARKLAVMCRQAARGFPPEEWALADQLRRAADSVVLNIGEGNAKGSNRDFRRFLETARGSLKEVEIIVDLAGDSGLIASPFLEELKAQVDETARTLYGLLRSVNDKVQRNEIDRLSRRRNPPPPTPPA